MIKTKRSKFLCIIHQLVTYIPVRVCIQGVSLSIIIILGAYLMDSRGCVGFPFFVMFYTVIYFVVTVFLAVSVEGK